MKKTILSFLLIISLPINAEYKIFSNNQNKINIPEPKTPEEPIGPEFWTAINVNIDGLYPNYSDSSSYGVGEGDFNFGQKPFQGDPKGFNPYDQNYNNTLWKNGTFHTGNFIRPNSNLSGTRYMKTYTSGQYYFELTVGGTSAADSMGMGNDTNTPLYNQNGIAAIGAVGTYFSHKVKYFNNTSSRWADNLSIVSGDTIQFYLDFDNNRFLAKKLGTTSSDYSSPVFE